MLTVNAAPAAPTITTQPANQTVTGGQTATFSVAASGTAPLSYQWNKNGSAISGATSPSYTTPATTTSDNGAQFTVVVGDASGSVTSNAATLIVNASGPTGTATDCTLFASPSGNDSNSGTSSSVPKTFSGAANATQPGSVVCLLAGTYNLSSTFVPPNSGTPSSWITYKAYGNGAVNFVWTGAADASTMFKVGNGSFPSGPDYIIFQGLNLNGSGNAADGFFCRGAHHLSFISNSISNTGGSGIASIACDYLVADHNVMNHNGYIPSSTPVPQYYSWTSGISYNSHVWFDNYAGIHSVISNNIVTGEVDQSSNHTDGNGIILDLGGNTPPVLIVNNVVYGNGGRCIEPNQVQNFYVINNTCYHNALDPTEPNFPEFGSNSSSNGYLVNNIGYSVSAGNPAYAQYGGSNVTFNTNLWDIGAPNFSGSFFNGNPLFVNPPSLNMGGYSNSLAPSLLGTGLTLQASSPAYNHGIDPSTLSGLNSSIVSDLKKYIYTDINGKPRPLGTAPDLGAYQH